MKFTRNKALCLLVGDSDHLLSRQLAHISREVFADGEAPAVYRFDGKKNDWSEVATQLGTGDLFSSKSLVVVDQAAAFFTAREKQLRQIAENGAPHVLVLLLLVDHERDRKVNKIRAFAKEFTRTIYLAEAFGPKPWKINEFIAQRARDQRLNLDRGAVSAVAARCGQDVARMDTMFEQLSLYAYPKTAIKAEHVVDLFGPDLHVEVFGLLGMVFAGQTAQALLRYRQYLASGAAPQVMVGLLLSQVRKYWAVFEAYENGLGPGQWASVLRSVDKGKPVPQFILERDWLPVIKRLNINVLTRWEIALRQMDVLSKSAPRATVERTLESMFIELAGAA